MVDGGLGEGDEGGEGGDDRGVEGCGDEAVEVEGAGGPAAEDVEEGGVFVLLVDVEEVFWGGGDGGEGAGGDVC